MAVIPCAAGLALVLFGSPGPAPQLLISEDGRLVALVHEGKAATNLPRPPDFIYDQWRRALRIDAHVPPVTIASAESDRRALSKSTSADAEAAATVTRAAADRNISPSSASARRARPADRRASDRPGWGGQGGGPADAAAARQHRLDMRTALAIAAEGKRFVCRRKEWCAGVAVAGWRVIWLEEPSQLFAACASADFVVSTRYSMRDWETRRCTSQARLITAGTLRTTGALEIAPVDDAETERPAKRVPNPAAGGRIAADIPTGEMSPETTLPGAILPAKARLGQAPAGHGPAATAPPGWPPADEPKAVLSAGAYRIHQAVEALDRPWNRHRLYDWRSGRYLGPERVVKLTGSGE